MSPRVDARRMVCSASSAIHVEVAVRTEIAVLVSGCAMAIGVACGSSPAPASPSTASTPSATSNGSVAFKAGGTVTGTYDFGSLPSGSYMFLATRDGFQDLARSVLLNRSMNNIDLLLYPVPPSGVTARCKDKSWSYAMDKATACLPRNGGVSYFVCPGPLC